MKRLEIKLDKDGYLKSGSGYRSYEGWFFYLDSQLLPGVMYSCRESFHYHPPTRPRRVGFCAKAIDGPKIERWWKKLENRLRIKRKTKIYTTQFRGTIALDVSHWWFKNAMRRSFFTLFLRGIHLYASPTSMRLGIRASIQEYYLARRIPKAIDLFLAGMTVPSESLVIQAGVGDQLFGLSISQLKARMLREVKS